MKPVALVYALLWVTAASALAQTQEAASARYRSVLAAHLTADQRIAGENSCATHTTSAHAPDGADGSVCQARLRMSATNPQIVLH
jgi:hypothetical protein